MQINVSQLLKEPIGSTRSYKLSETADITGEGKESPVEGDIKLTRTNRGILAQGTIHSSIQINCSRCLCIFDCPLTFTIEEEFFPEIDILSGLPVPQPEEPGYFYIDEHHILDLAEAVRQNATIAIPMKPLCREECAGLCAVCGQDLNVKTCDCQHPVMDSRWSKLALLKQSKSKKRKGTE